MIENIRVNVISNSITASDKAKSIHRRKMSKYAGNLNYINHSCAEYRSFVMLTSFSHLPCTSCVLFEAILLKHTAYIMDCTSILY